MSRPGELHGLVCAAIVVILWAFAAQRKRGYVCCNDTGVLVERDPDTVRGPDILFFDRVVTAQTVSRKWGDLLPCLAVEVLSPTNTLSEVNERIADQLNAGTPLVWLVDPEAFKVTVYRQHKPISVLKETDEITGEDVLPDFRCKVADFFKAPGQ